MIGAAAAYMSGLFFASFFTEGSDFLLLAILLPVFFVLSRFFFKLKICDIVIICLFFSAAFSAYQLHTHLKYDKIIAYSGCSCSFKGEIVNYKDYSNARSAYILDGVIDEKTGAKIMLYTDSLNVEIGDTLYLENCQLEIPDSDYLFDYEKYYKPDNIFLQSKKTEIKEIGRNEDCRLANSLKKFRDVMSLKFSSETGAEDGAFLNGILFGKSSELDNSERTLLYRSGIGHVVAVSGLHISLIAALIYMLMNALGSNKYISFAVMELFILLMIALVEYPVSAVRAAIMLSFFYGARLFLRQNDTFNSLACAVLLMCLFNPYIIHDAGFMLSVSGTYGIAVLGPYIAGEIKPRTLKNLIIFICVSIVLMPVSLYWFDEVSIISPVTNLMIVPLCITAMISGLIYVISFGNTSVLLIARICIDAVRVMTDRLGRLSITHISSGNGILFTVTLICAAMTILIYFVCRSRKLTALALAVSVTIFTVSSVITEIRGSDKFRLAVLGKGADCAVVINTGADVYIYDFGGHYKTSQYVCKYLYSNGIGSVNAVFLTDNEASQYAAYRKELELIDIGGYVTDEKIETLCTVSADHMKSVTEGNDCILTYYDKVLTAQLGEFTAEIRPSTGYEYLGDENDITILYGKLYSHPVGKADGSVVYLGGGSEGDCINNFEITVSAEDGKWSVRRL